MSEHAFAVKTVLPDCACVECGAVIVTAHGNRNASEGALALCMLCGSLNIVTADLRLRPPTVEEFLRAAADSRMQEVRRKIYAANGRATHQPPARHRRLPVWMLVMVFSATLIAGGLAWLGLIRVARVLGGL